MTTTILTDGQIFDCFDMQCAEFVVNFDADELYPVGRAIEQAVLQSHEVQAWKKDAERYRWLRDNNAYFPEENYVRGGQELDKAIDAAMEKQP